MTSETKAVLQNQTAIKAVEQTIAQLEAAILEQERIIAEGNVSGREELDRKREDLHAAMAVGKATAADLAKLAAELAAHGEAVKVAEAASAPARAAKAGLQRRTEREKHTLKHLMNDRETTRRALFMAEAETAGEEFVRTANDLHALFGRLTALNVMLGDENILGISQTTPYQIPTLRLAAFGAVRGSLHLHDMGQLAGPGMGAPLLNTERARLHALGVDPE